MATNVLIAFYSRGGSTEALANAIAEGARESGAEVRLRRAREIVGPEIMQLAPGWLESADRMNALYEAPTAADAEWADAILFGTPTRFGNVSSELKAYHRRPRRTLGPGQAQRQSGRRVHFQFHPPRRQRDDHAFALCPDGPPRPDHRADRLRRPRHVRGRISVWRVVGFVQPEHSAHGRGPRRRPLSGPPHHSR
jgi:hypothetical protein